jgi:RNA polymerase sigma-70 factor (ECF subfamily)
VPYRLEQDELGIEIEKAIQQLSPRQKQVFVLRHYEDLSLREIADLLNLRIGSIKAHLFSATRKLRKLLTPYLEE